MKISVSDKFIYGLIVSLAIGLLMAAYAGSQEQSPVVIDPAAVAEDPALPTLNFMYGRTDLRVVNEGPHEEFGTVQAFLEPPGAGKLMVGDDEFTLLRFHWHIPSEHELPAKEFPMEMHLVHHFIDAAGQEQLLVVGVWIEQGRRNRELDKIFAKLPQLKEEEREVRFFNLARLLPNDISSFRYDGSLTTPTSDAPFEPFREGVKWIVLKKPIQMSARQIRAFGRLFLPESNDRDTQPLGDRVVLTEPAEEPPDDMDDES